MRLNPVQPPEKVVYDNVVFRRLGGKKRRYYGGVIAGVFKGLHVAIWEAEYGPVPPEHDIHHRDSDTFNCMIDNLECLPKAVHRRQPKNLDMVAQNIHLNRVRPLATLWHKSEEGQAWHKRVTALHLVNARAKVALFGIPLKDGGVCLWCGNPFQYKNIRKKTCSMQCHWQHKDFRSGKRKTAHPYFLGNKPVDLR